LRSPLSEVVGGVAVGIRATAQGSDSSCSGERLGRPGSRLDGDMARGSPLGERVVALWLNSGQRASGQLREAAEGGDHGWLLAGRIDTDCAG
jgi:hypothetical protein